MKLEHYYKVAVDAAVDRNQRWLRFLWIPYMSTSQHNRRIDLERRLQADALMTEERKRRQLHQLGRKESNFLRLKRTKLGLDSFRTVKVIGKGAFGEVLNARIFPS